MSRSWVVVVAVLSVASVTPILANAQVPPTYVGQWGGLGTEDGRFHFPSNTALDAAGNLYVCDYHNHRIQKFDDAGNFLMKFSAPGPWDVAVGSDGSIFVSCGDASAFHVRKYSPAGVQLLSWEVLNSVGVPDEPMGIAVSAGGEVLVGTKGGMLAVFDAMGTRLRGWNVPGPAGGGIPDDVEVDGTGTTYVAVRDLGIYKYDSVGNLLLTWSFAARGLAVTSTALYATEGERRIRVYTHTGQLLGQWGNFGTGPGQFNEPFGVEVNAIGEVFVADHRNHRIQKFGNGVTIATRPTWGALKIRYR